jgi:tungstate transport system permease protein
VNYLFDSLGEAWKLLVSFDPEVWIIIGTSLKVSVAAAVLASIVGVPLGLWIALREFRAKGAVLVVLNTLMALPTVVVGLFMYGMIGRRGPLGALGLLFTPAGIVIGEFILALPIIANLTITAVKSLDERLFLTCKSLGAGALHEAFMILREGRYGIVAAVVAGWGRVIAEVGIAMMLGGNIKGFTRTMTTAIALETSKGEFELGLALGMVLLLVALAINVVLYLLQVRER